jgi:hypothetical protein
MTDKILTTNITATIRKMKKNGTTGASLACLKQNVSTRGLMCSISEYNERFPIVAKSVAKQNYFEIIES